MIKNAIRFKVSPGFWLYGWLSMSKEWGVFATSSRIKWGWTVGLLPLLRSIGTSLTSTSRQTWHMGWVDPMITITRTRTRTRSNYPRKLGTGLETIYLWICIHNTSVVCQDYSISQILFPGDRTRQLSWKDRWGRSPNGNSASSNIESSFLILSDSIGPLNFRGLE